VIYGLEDVKNTMADKEAIDVFLCNSKIMLWTSKAQLWVTSALKLAAAKWEIEGYLMQKISWRMLCKRCWKTIVLYSPQLTHMVLQDMLLPVMMLNIKHLKMCSVYINSKFWHFKIVDDRKLSNYPATYYRTSLHTCYSRVA